jgi:hypothetical protein
MARPDHVFGDTSFFFACLEPVDTYHQRALEMARRVADDRDPSDRDSPRLEFRVSGGSPRS